MRPLKTIQRDAMVARFQEVDEPVLFLLSLNYARHHSSMFNTQVLTTHTGNCWS